MHSLPPDQLDALGAAFARPLQIAWLVQRRFPEAPLPGGMSERQLRLLIGVLTRNWDWTLDGLGYLHVDGINIRVRPGA